MICLLTSIARTLLAILMKAKRELIGGITTTMRAIAKCVWNYVGMIQTVAVLNVKKTVSMIPMVIVHGGKKENVPTWN